MRYFSPLAPPSLAVALGATTPVGEGPGARIWSTTTGCELVWDGAQWIVPGDGVLRVALGTEYTNSTTTLTDVSGLSFAVVAGVAYEFNFMLAWRCAATTASGIGLSINGPAQDRLVWATDIATSATARTLRQSNAYNDPTSVTVALSSTLSNWAHQRGVVRPTANGTLQLRARAGTAGSLATILAGASFGSLRVLSNAGNVASNPPLLISQNAATSYTFTLADANAEEEFTSGSAVSATIPPESSVNYPVGTILLVTQGGAGQVTIVPGAGVTINTRTTLKTAGQWSTISLKKRGSNLWVASGDLAAS
jgi:hypothetical protein